MLLYWVFIWLVVVVVLLCYFVLLGGDCFVGVWGVVGRFCLWWGFVGVLVWFAGLLRLLCCVGPCVFCGFGGLCVYVGPLCCFCCLWCFRIWCGVLGF